MNELFFRNESQHLDILTELYKNMNTNFGIVPDMGGLTSNNMVIYEYEEEKCRKSYVN
jgi:hypothetical protein